MRFAFKNSLLVAGVLATLLAGSALASTPAQDAAVQNRGQMYNDRVEQGPAKNDDVSVQSRGHRYNERVEQRAVQTEDAASRQSRDIKSKDGSREWRGGCGGDRDIFRHDRDGYRCREGIRQPGMRDGYRRHEGFREAPGRRYKLTDAQKQQLGKDRNEIFKNWPDMTREERYEAREKFIQRVNEERMKNMTAEEQAVFRKEQAERKAEREKLFRMTPAEKEQWRRTHPHRFRD